MRKLATFIQRGIIAQETMAHEELINKKFVFLGGTVNDSTWRDQLIALLTVAYFNPVVKDWTEEHAARENQAKGIADVNLFVLTPKQHGFYVPLEMGVMACESRDDPEMKVVIVFLNEDAGEVFSEAQQKSNVQMRELLLKNQNVEIFDNLEDTAKYINTYLTEKAASESNGD